MAITVYLIKASDGQEINVPRNIDEVTRWRVLGYCLFLKTEIKH